MTPIILFLTKIELNLRTIKNHHNNTCEKIHSHISAVHAF